MPPKSQYKLNAKRRYYLHRQLRKILRVNGREKAVFLPDGFQVPSEFQPYLDELRQMGYNIQHELV